MNPVECVLRFLTELERLVPGKGTRQMINSSEDGKLEIRLGNEDHRTAP